MDDTVVVVVGVALRLPDADDLVAFRRNLRSGRDSVRRPSGARLTSCGLPTDVEYAPQGNIDRVDLFDHQAFGLSRREAEAMDPHHRMALELAHFAIEDAGHRVGDLRNSRTAVFLSAGSTEYTQFMQPEDTTALLGTGPSGLTGRISHQFGFTGASVTVDTGCSSALAAVHYARRELLGGDADYCVVGGVSLNLIPDLTSDLANFPEVMSPSSRSRAFDALADGTVQGEGGAVLLLTTMRRARDNGNRVYVAIRGTAIGHNGGRSGNIASPSAAAQTDVVRDAWCAAGLAPSAAGYVEAHGSGTRLGDAVEVVGLGSAVEGLRPPLPIGSVKTNIGHLGNAAGMAGLVKVLLSLRHGELYPSLHFTAAPAQVDLEGAGLEVVTAFRPWPALDEQPRRAGISAFSLTGTNVHCVLEEVPHAQGPQVRTGPRVCTVSARTPKALALQGERLAAALDDDIPLAGVARVLNRGRDHHRYRAAFVCRDHADLRGSLASLDADSARPALIPGPRLFLLLSRDAVVPRHAPCAALPGDAGRLIEWQHASYRELVGLGVTPDGILTSGASRHVARLARGECTTADVRDALADTADTPTDTEHVMAVIDDLVRTGPVVFMELGGGGELLDLVHARHSPLTVSVDDLGLLGAVADLYQRGVRVDWDRHHHTVDGDQPPTTVSLPPVPFEGEPCWAGARPAHMPSLAAQPEPKPGSTVGERIQEAFKDVLHVDDVPGDLDFFSLGGNSIMATLLIGRIAGLCGVSLRILDIYDHRTPDQLAALVVRRAELLDSVDVVDEVELVGGGPPALSFGQERMWFHQQMEPHSSLYNLPAIYRISGGVDVAALRAALRAYAQRHEVLRSRILTRDGAPELVIDPSLPEVLRALDLSGRADPLDEAMRTFDQEVGTPIDLAEGPLFRTLLLTLSPEEHLLGVVVHHAVDDGWSPPIFDAELTEFYAASLEGREPRLEPLAVQYSDFARWQRAWLEGPQARAQVDHWKEVLRDVPVLNLPTDRARPDRKDFEGDVLTFVLPEKLVRSLREIGARESTTLFTVMLAAYCMVLSRYSRQDDIVVGTPTAGRSKPETLGLVGFFINTLALRVDLSGDPTFTELLGRVRTVVLTAMQHSDIPFEKVVEATSRSRDAGRHPVFDVAFVHQKVAELPGELLGARMSLYESGDRSILHNSLPRGTSKFDLTFSVWEQAGRGDVLAGLEFATSLFKRTTAERFVATLLAYLAEIAAGRPRDASALPVVADWSDTGSQQLELEVQRLFKLVLQVEEVGLDDDFFDLGGHSLLAVRLLAEVEATIGHRPPIVTLFEHSTPTAFARAISVEPTRGDG